MGTVKANTYRRFWRRIRRARWQFVSENSGTAAAPAREQPV
jgi:hypothetical protein